MQKIKKVKLFPNLDDIFNYILFIIKLSKE